MKKKDGYLIGIILVIVMVLFGVLRIDQKSVGAKIQITIDGKEYNTYSLQENQIIEIKNDFGYNKIKIVNGKAKMIEANCPDGLCEQQNEISHKNESIICLPHKLVVEVISEQEDEAIDGIAK